MDYKEIANLIKNSEKKTTCKCHIQFKNDITLNTEFGKVKVFGNYPYCLLIGEFSEIKNILETHKDKISVFHYEIDARNSALPMFKKEFANCRIEPGAIIRDGVEIGENCVIMMGAVINIGSVIEEGTMIDMNAVLGARATVGKNCHIGAGAVLAGVLEPPSASPVIIEDNVMIGANVVVLEGVRIGKNAVIGAGSIVTKDIPADTVAIGSPAKIIKQKDEKTKEKTQLLEELRG